jgi:CRP-like cAMP-binding protein
VSTPTPGTRSDPRRNLLLGHLPEDEFHRLLPELEAVDVDVRDQAYQRGKAIEHLWFPVDCVFSLIATVDGEAGVEVATLGYEGLVGLPAFLGTAESPHDCFCQIAGSAVRLPVSELRRFLSGGGALHDLLHQEFLAQMLGVRRGTVSLTAGVLQQAGVIRYTRGRITVLDADALHEAACDCYDIVQAEYQRLTSAPEA